MQCCQKEQNKIILELSRVAKAFAQLHEMYEGHFLSQSRAVFSKPLDISKFIFCIRVPYQINPLPGMPISGSSNSAANMRDTF